MKVVIAKTAFTGADNVQVGQGTLWDADHPVVKRYRDQFQPVEEVATAAPAPDKKPAKKAASKKS